MQSQASVNQYLKGRLLKVAQKDNHLKSFLQKLQTALNNYEYFEKVTIPLRALTFSIAGMQYHVKVAVASEEKPIGIITLRHELQNQDDMPMKTYIMEDIGKIDENVGFETKQLRHVGDEDMVIEDIIMTVLKNFGFFSS